MILRLREEAEFWISLAAHMVIRWQKIASSSMLASASEGQKAALEKFHLYHGEPWYSVVIAGYDLAAMNVRYSPEGKYSLEEKYKAYIHF